MCNAWYLYIINKTYNPVTSRALLKKYQSLSEKGMYDTILTRKNRRKNCLALREQVLRRFFRVFMFVLYFVDIQCDMQIFCTFSFLGSVEKRAKSLVRQSILHPHLDYLAVSLRQSCIPT